jgi:hypothetical protein
MDPLTLALLLGGGGSVISSFLGANAQQQAIDQNTVINQQNIEQRQREIEEARKYAEMIREEQKLGSTNAAGDSVRYVEGQGWVTTPSARNRELMDYFYNVEIPVARSQQLQQIGRSGANNQMAQQLLAELQNVRQVSPREIEGLILAAGSTGIGEATRDSTEGAMRAALRTGSSNSNELLDQIAQSAMQQRQQLHSQAALSAREMAASEYDNKRSNLANLYNMFDAKATAPIGSATDVNTATSGGNSLLSAFAQMAQQGNSQGMNAASIPGMQQQNVEANTAWSDAIGASANAISGGFMAHNSAQRLQNQNDLLMYYMTQGGQLGGGGIMESIAARTGNRGNTF